MSNTKEEIITKVRVFFKNIKWKKILTFSFFLLLSTIFWIMQIYRQKFESTYTIPIKYTNIPDSIIFENKLPLKIEARIKEGGGTLFRYYFTKRKDSLEINIKKLISRSSDRIIEGSAFEQMVRSKLFVTSELISTNPNSISYRYDILEEKRVPVIYDGYINLNSGHIIDGDLSIVPDYVTVYGSRAALDTISFAHTVNDTLNNITEDKIVSIDIAPIKGVKFVPNKIELAIPIDEYTMKVVEVPIECVNLPPHLSIKFFPSFVKIPFYVGLKRYKDITTKDFEIKIDYNDLKDLKSPTIPVRIVKSPDYVKTRMPEPSEVEFILEQE